MGEKLQKKKDLCKCKMKIVYKKSIYFLCQRVLWVSTENQLKNKKKKNKQTYISLGFEPGFVKALLKVKYLKHQSLSKKIKQWLFLKKLMKKKKKKKKKKKSLGKKKKKKKKKK